MDSFYLEWGVRAWLHTSALLSATPVSWFFHGQPRVLSCFSCVHLIPWDNEGFFVFGWFRVFLKDERYVGFSIFEFGFEDER